MAIHSSILAWKIPWTQEPGGLQSRVKESDMTERVNVVHMALDSEPKTSNLLINM